MQIHTNFIYLVVILVITKLSINSCRDSPGTQNSIYQGPVRRTLGKLVRKYDAEVFGLHLFSKLSNLNFIQKMTGMAGTISVYIVNIWYEKQFCILEKNMDFDIRVYGYIPSSTSYKLHDL